jgi:TnpA family transposase
MPTLNLLTETQRAQLETFPQLDSREIARHYTLSDEDVKLIHKRRGDHNRLGFTVQLAHLRFPGWTYSADRAVPTAMLLYLARQLQINPAALADYAKERDTTRHEHLAEITRTYGYRRFSETADELRGWLLDVALSTDNGLLLAQTFIERMRACKVIIPSLYTVERLAWEVRLQARTQVQGYLTSWLSETQKTKLDGLLLPERAGGLSSLTWLRLAPQNPTPRGFLRLLEKLEHIRELQLDDAAAKRVHQNRLRTLAREGSRATPHNLKRLAAEHRYAVLVAFLLDVSAKITDELLEMHDRMMSSLLRRSENQRDEAFSRQAKSINEKVQLYATLGRALIEAKEDGNDPFEVIDSLLGWDTFTTTVEEAWGLAQPLNFDYLMFMLNRFTWLRQYTPSLIASFAFKAAPATRDLLAAIELLRELT